MKKCPMCAEEIQDEALKCKHCGERLEKTQVEDEEVLVNESPSYGRYTLFFLMSGTLLLLSVQTKDLYTGLWALLPAAVALFIQSNIKYTITTKRIKIKTGFFSSREAEIDIKHIRDVVLLKGVYGRERFGQITIRSASTNIGGIFFDGIRLPTQRVALIKELQAKNRE